jgi:hypothetical protein
MADPSGTPSENGRAIREPFRGHQRLGLDTPAIGHAGKTAEAEALRQQLA